MLVDASVRELGKPYYTATVIDLSLQHLFGVDTVLIEDQTYFVVEDSGRIVGCGGWSYRQTPFGGDHHGDLRNAAVRDPRAEPAVIRAFFVHPDAARRGIGRMILEACEEEARGAGYRKLELTATLPGEPFYLSCGYSPTRRYDVELPEDETLEVVTMFKSAA